MTDTLLMVALLLAGDGGGKAEAAKPEPADLVAYLSEIRAAGMTEGARDSLGFVAGVRSGSSLFTVGRDEATGRYTHTFQSVGCALKGADPEKLAKLEEERRRREEADLKVLRGHADFDGSGFISTEEGQEFRSLFELGQVAAFVIQKEGRDLEELGRAAGLDAQEARERLLRYNAIAASVGRESDLPMPVVAIP